jgi:2-octaprenyl-6-methoxyphenol hydroxylase
VRIGAGNGHEDAHSVDVSSRAGGGAVTDPRFDVAIAGAGYSGLAMAIALTKSLPGVTVGVLAGPARGGEENAGWAFSLSAASVNLLTAVGVWPALELRAQAMTGIDITDTPLEAAVRPVLLHYDNTLPDGGAGAWVVEARDLVKALQAAVARAPEIVVLHDFMADAVSVGAQQIRVVSHDGQACAASVLVAADGRRSAVRTLLGIKTVGWSYAQDGIVAIVEHERPHQGRATQHFLPSGPFAMLPLPGNRMCITWSEEREAARTLVAGSDEDFLAAVQARFGYRLGAVTLASGPTSFPLEMHLARSFAGERTALIGDAAHGIHPLAGQGLNLGFRDVAALSEVIADAMRLGLDPGTANVLGRYQRWRRFDAALQAAAMDAMNRLFSNDATLLRTMRDAGLGLVDRMPGVKQLLVEQAAGLSGEVPRLLRGDLA